MTAPLPTAQSATDADGDLFLQGTYLELGISALGNLGTTPGDMPAGFARAGTHGVGLTYNAAGFGVNPAIPTIDFFTPGTPWESFAAGYTQSGTNYSGNNYGYAGIEGVQAVSLTDTSSGSTLSADWVGILNGDLRVTIDYSFGGADQYFTTKVTLTNLSGAAMSDVRYDRNVDPDNTEFAGGDYATVNTIVAQAPGSGFSEVTATSASGDAYDTATGSTATLAYYSTNLGVRVADGYNFGRDTLDPFNPAFTTLAGAAGSTTGLSDTAINLNYDGGALEAGASTSFTYYTGVTDDIDSVIAAIAAASAAAPPGPPASPTVAPSPPSDSGGSGDSTPPSVTAAFVANPLNAVSNGIVYSPILAGGGDPFATVVISAAGAPIGTVQANAAGGWTFDPSGLAPGGATLTASETDPAGNTATTSATPLTQPVPRFDVTNETATTTGSTAGSDYTGPVSYLRAQFAYIGPDNVVIGATVPNTFLLSGAGDDALQASGGNNVLDGGTGSNWLVGGNGSDGGHDTFFVDGRDGRATWDTLLNFRPGDMLTIWGYDSASGHMKWQDGQGASGYQGDTLQATLGGGGPSVFATFDGLSSHNAHFTTSTGTAGGVDYLAITRVA